jgi:hypothetical protein
MMVVIETLARFTDAPQTVFQRLKTAWTDQGYEIVETDEKRLEMVCTAQSYRRVRVHIKTICFAEGDDTILQIIYTPALTPAMSRPVSLKPYVQRGVRADLEDRIRQVLNQGGSWMKTSHDEVHQQPERLEDPESIQKAARRSTAILQLFFGLGVAAVGALMSYLHFEGIFVFGSYELWLTAAVIGIIVFCIGLFGLIWGK